MGEAFIVVGFLALLGIGAFLEERTRRPERHDWIGENGSRPGR